MTIGSWRSEIDTIDSEILKLIQKRIGIVQEIGRVKAKAGLPLVDEEREREIIKRLLRECVKPLSSEAVTTIFNCLIRESRRVQTEDTAKIISDRKILK